MDENRYYKRCIKMLKDLNAPIDGWECVDMTDRGFADFTCELDPSYVAKSSEVYNEYRIFCT